MCSKNNKNLKKVGILTFHNALNYGAVLQTYALQQTISQLPAKVEIIDYRCPQIEKQYRSILGAGKKIDRIKHGLMYFQYCQRNRIFAHFCNHRLKLSKQYFISQKELLKVNSQYDFFVVGSDQVWNAFITGLDETYLLNFVDNNRKKISYAASFGFPELPDEWKPRYKLLLESFYGLSVREQQGADILGNLTGRDAHVHIDPVLLMKADEWKRIAAPIKEQNYIFVYLMAKTETILKFIEELANQTGYKVIWFGPGLRRPIRAKYIRTGSPEEFLGYLLNASYVVTNSFHGTAFSILFHKAFFIELLPRQHNSNSRLEQILNLFHLSDRLILDKTKINIQGHIDYAEVEKILDKEREKSIHYLKKVLGFSL